MGGTWLIGLCWRVRRAVGVARCLDLSTKKVFKIDARFPLGRRVRAAVGRVVKRSSRAGAPVPRKILAAIGGSLDDSACPFRAIALRAGVTEDKVVESIKRGKSTGVIRRFGAVLDHNKIGLTSNALVAWQVREKDIPAVAKAMSSFPEISHCYQRKQQPGWPYTMYTMVHAADRPACRAIIKLILRTLGHTIEAYRVLFTVRELKKTRFNTKRIFTWKSGENISVSRAGCG